MGNKFVAPVEPFQNGEITHFVIAPSGYKGSFTFVGQKIDSKIVHAVRDQMQPFCKKPIELKEKEEWVTKLSTHDGFSWGYDSDNSSFKDSFRQRICWTKLFQACHQQGFKPMMSTDMQRYDTIQNFQVFEKTLEEPPAHLAIVSLSSWDSIQLVSEIEHHDILLDSLVSLINENWKLAQIKVKEKTDIPESHKSYKCSAIDLGKSPWSYTAGAETLTTGRFLLAHIASKLAKDAGWSLYTSANVKGFCDYMWFGKAGFGSSGFSPTAPVSNNIYPSLDNTQAPPAYAPSVPIWELPPPPQYFEASFGYQSRFFENREPGLISLSSDDKLRVCGFGNRYEDIHQLIRKAANIAEIPIKNENAEEFKHISNGIEFKFKGSPWWCSKQKAVRTRILFLKIFEGLIRKNFRILCSLDTSRKLQDKSSFVVVPTEEGVVPDFGRVRSLAICASDVDHLRIIGDYNDGEIKDLLNVIRQSAKQGMNDHPENCIDETMKLDVMSKNWRSHFIDFKGWVWANWNYTQSYANPGGLAVMLVGNMVSCIRKQGWELVCQADVSAKFRHGGEHHPDYKVDVDTWYFIKVEK